MNEWDQFSHCQLAKKQKAEHFSFLQESQTWLFEYIYNHRKQI